MQYSPKLKKAMEEIKQVLQKYDIAGSVVLHSPGFSEYLNHLRPSYSCAYLEQGGIRFKTKGRKHEDIESTVNMITHFAETSAHVSLQYYKLKEMLQKHMDIDEDDGSHSDHIEQNN